MERFAKIIATLGPSSSNKETLRAMMLAGLNVARLNFSHSTHADHRKTYDTVRQVANELNLPIGILADLSGPKIRVGLLPAKGLVLLSDETIVVTSMLETSDKGIDKLKNIPINLPHITAVFQPGNRIILDDGKLELEVTKIENDYVKTRVISGGILLSHKGVNLPGSQLDINPLTDKDLHDLEFALNLGVDSIAVSFVRKKSDILTARQKICEFTGNESSNIPIIAKIERPEAVDNLDEILLVTDGIMVARGDLGIETSTASVPIIQKIAIQKAAQYARYVITATQMLESMIVNPRPTRAEASDIANAVFDGTDAVMLSGETAIGKYPVESIQNMDDIVRKAEQHKDSWSICAEVHFEGNTDDAISICRAARELAHDRNVACAAVFTLTGKTALLMSKVRPRVPIHAFTPYMETYQRLSLYWGVIPHLVPFAPDVEKMIEVVDQALQSSTIYENGQQVVIISGLPVNAQRSPNMALLHTIGEPY